jgi:probable HAF family extracellular repeat protein
MTIRGRRSSVTFVDANGVAGSTFAISDTSYRRTPDVAASGSSALVVWSEGDIFGRRINADGTLLDAASGMVISNAPNGQFTPKVAWDGTQFLVDWVDQRNYPYPAQPGDDIYGARVDANGNLLDPNGFAIASTPLPESVPSLAAMNGTTLFAFSAFKDRAPYAAYRTTLRRFPFNLDYSISASPSAVTLAPGGTATVTVAVTAVNGFNGPVTFEVAGLPPGVRGTFAPATVNGAGSTTLTITTSASTPVEIYPVTVTAGSSPQQSVAVLILNITNAPAPPRFNVTDLGTLGGLSSEAWGLNAAGQVVGWAQNASGQRRAFRYSGGIMQDLGTLGGNESAAYDINSAGDVVGYAKIADGTRRAFRYTSGVMQDLGTFNNIGASEARGINDAGQITGFSELDYQGGGPNAFLLTNGNMVNLGSLGGGLSYGFKVNASGQVAGWTTRMNGSPRGFRYTAATWRS